MTLTQKPQAQQIFPDYIRDEPLVDKEGNLSALWDWGLATLFQALQENFKNEGILVPGLTTESMTTIANIYAPYIGGELPQDQTPASQQNIPNISGQFVYCSDTKFLNQFVIAYNSSNEITLAQWVPIAITLTGAVNPNGVQAGILGWQYINTAPSKPVLYVCTTAGSKDGSPAPQAVWTAV